MPDHIRHTNYECKQCNYFTQKKNNYTRHLNSNKHLKKTQNLVVENTQNLMVEKTTQTENHDFKKKYEEAQHNYIELLEKHIKLLKTNDNQ